MTGPAVPFHEIGGVPRAFARLVSHDNRSRAYGVVVNPRVELKTVLWDNEAPTLDQGQTGSCTGNAGAQWKNTALSITLAASAGPTPTWLVEDDAVLLYSRGTQIDDIPGEYPPDDTGSSGLAVAKAMQERNLIRSYRHAFTMTQVLAALQAGPVMIGTAWLAGMEQPGRGGFLKVDGDEIGGHEYLLRGVDVEHEFVTMLNSWGSSWGDNGSARIHCDDLQKLLRAQGDATVPMA